MSPAAPRGTVALEVGSSVDELAALRLEIEQLRAREAEHSWLAGELDRLGTLLLGPGDRREVLPSVLTGLMQAVGARGVALYRTAVAGTPQAVFESESGHAEWLVLAQRAAQAGTRQDARYNLAQPALFEGKTLAVLVLALSGSLSETRLALIERIASRIGSAWAAGEDIERSAAMLERYRVIASELKLQQEKLSGEMREVAQKNREVEQSKAAVEEKAEQLALSSRYKSEFLANMSHELRTPLNSLLILAKLLADNREGNLNGKQIEYARTILAAGTDLLSLINDILDLAKVESGTVTLNIAQENLSDLNEYVESNFRPMAVGKELGFEIAVAPELPPTMDTDSKRLRQILKNLLSNAFKFTERGSVRVSIEPAQSGWSAGHSLDRSGPVIAFCVRDTGIGIPKDKQKIIFEEFQQADGTTSRHYGGTGLGLSISRELARLLGGEIVVDSTPGEGSTFVLYVPVAHDWVRSPAGPDAPHGDAAAPGMGSPTQRLPTSAKPERGSVRPADDRRSIAAGDRVAVLVEADAARGATLLSLVRERGFKGVIAADAASAVAAARDIAPDVLVMRLDSAVPAPGEVLEALSRDTVAARIPVKVFCRGGERDECRTLRVAWSAEKALDRQSIHEALAAGSRLAGRAARRILVADADETHRQGFAAMLREEEFETSVAASMQEVIAAFAGAQPPELLIVGAKLADASAGEFAARWLALPPSAVVPWVLHRAAAPDQSGRPRIEVCALDTRPSLREALNELFASLADDSRGLISEAPAQAQQKNVETQPSRLDGKTALIIDDDIRNIFALTSALEHYGMRVAYAESARQGIEMLRQRRDTSVALVDVMMPEVDGYDAIRMIRAMEGFAELPVIAVTAKAMKGDREKCIAAGASDYLSKPVRIEQLLALLKTWVK